MQNPPVVKHDGISFAQLVLELCPRCLQPCDELFQRMVEIDVRLRRERCLERWGIVDELDRFVLMWCDVCVVVELDGRVGLVVMMTIVDVVEVDRCGRE